MGWAGPKINLAGKGQIDLRLYSVFKISNTQVGLTGPFGLEQTDPV